MTRRSLSAVVFAAVAVFFTASIHSQAMPTARRRGGEIRVGVAYSNGSSDLVTKRIGGFSGYGSYSLLRHFAVEADVHLLQFFTPQDFAERSYEAGGRLFYRYRRYEPYAKFMGGVLQTVNQGSGYQVIKGTPDAYGMFSGAGGLDILVPKKLVVRGEYERQVLPGFSPRDLSPSLFSIGVAYRLR